MTSFKERASSCLVCLAIVLLLLFALAAPVLAHGGRTDDDGGHYDSETGEYHYHHGYPAHDHYDMDGDGFADCPYDFVDRTGWNSGSTDNDYVSSYVSTPNEEETATPVSGEETIPVSTFVLICIVFVIAFASAILKIKSVNKELEESQCKIDALSKEVFDSQKRYYQLMYGDKTQAEIMNAPQGCGVDSLDMPYCFTQPKDKREWGDYTVFISSYGKCYHSRKGCSSANTPKNVACLNSALYSPCRRCKPTTPDLAWFEQYKTHMEIIRKYDIKLKEETQYIYAKAANGLTVRIPANKYQDWQKAQDEIRAGKRKANPEMVKSLRAMMEKSRNE